MVEEHQYTGAIHEMKLGPLKIWEMPQEGHKYVIGSDVAEGKMRDMASSRKRDMLMAMTSDQPDYSASIVLDMETGKHCASWHGTMSPAQYAIAVMGLGYWYNMALLAPERNNHGIVLVQAFHDRRYPHIYRKHVDPGTITNSPVLDTLGWTTSAVSRPLLITRIAEMITHYPDFTRDKELVSELRTMEVDLATGTPRGKGRNKDDRVLALGIALQARNEYLQRESPPEEVVDDGLSHYDRQIWNKLLDRAANNDGTEYDRDRNRLGVGPRGDHGLADAGPTPDSRLLGEFLRQSSFGRR